MPNEFSNFTNPDATAPVKRDPYNPANTSYRTYDGARWGGEAEAHDVNNNPIYGTSGADVDASRYRAMGGMVPSSGPQIDQTQANQALGYSNDALGLLQRTASGEAPSQAEMLARQQAQAGQNAQLSAAGSVRGGPQARAAALRNAMRSSADIGARGAQQAQAVRAAEMANARGLLSNAANQQRAQDLGVAGSQADLEAQQRALNAAHQQAYEQMAWDTKNASMNQQLGRSAADQAAENQNRAMGSQEDAAAWGRYKDVYNTVASGARGGAGGMGSDERMKTDIHPVSDKEASRLQRAAAGIKAGLDAGYASHPRTVGDSTTDILSLIDRGRLGNVQQRKAPTEATRYANGQDGIGTAALHAGIEQSIADTPAAPADAPPLRLSAAPKGYAASRRGQAGSMFGGERAEARYGAFDNGATTGRDDEANGFAPGTTDFGGTQLAKAGETDPFSAAIMRSDSRAKAEAWDEGHQAALADVQKWSSRSPEELAKANSPIAKTVRGLKADAWDEGHGRPVPTPPVTPPAKAEPIRVQPEVPWNFDAPQQQAQAIAATQRAADSFEPLQHAPTTLDKITGALGGASDRVYDNVSNAAFSAAPPPSSGLTSSRTGARIAEKMRQLESENALQQYAASMRSDKTSKVLADGASENEMHAKTPVLLDFKAKPGQAKASNTGFSSALSKIRARAASLEQDDAMTSDERAKEPAKGSDAMADALRSMKPSAYRYKPGMGPPTQHEGDVNVGPMAQNMAADPVARTAIVVEPDTGLLAIDKEKALKLSLGGLADLQHQLDDLKKRRSA